MAASKAERPHDRASEYIDSPLMTQRLVHKRQISARIDGVYGVYRTTARVGRSRDASCTGPSDDWPCKHVRALRATWDVNPQSFFDLSRFLKALGTEPKAELVGAIRDLLLAYPEGLGVLGVSEFSADDDEEDYEE